MKFINLTPHVINIIKEGGETFTIEPSGEIARAQVSKELIGEFDGIPVYKSVYGETTGIPESKENTVYIVSSLAAQGAKGREDVFVPDDPVRNENGQIIGCRGLAKI